MHTPSFPVGLERRDFLKTAAALGLVTAAGLRTAPAAAVDDLVAELVRLNDAGLPALLARQERRAGHRWLGGQVNEYGLHVPNATAGFVSALACATVAPASRYHNAADLDEPLRLAARYLLAAQHEDGTVDYYATNFHSPPDMAFILEVLCPAYVLLRRSERAAVRAAGEEIGRFIVRGADGLVTGGVHTPNHRWVVCAALASAHMLFPQPRYVARINQWLAETVDLDPDGQYTEKSTTVYSPIVDRALINVARQLRRPDLFEPVRRNLEMTLFYVHPDGEVVTEASRRQDRNQRGSMARYYFAYRHLALLDGNGRFAAMARQIEQAYPASLLADLSTFLTEPDFGRALPASAALPTDYAKVFSHSSLVRIRRGDASGTILANNTTLFSYRRGSAALEAVRLASAFFGKGQFTSETLEVRDGKYVLRQELEGPYFQPLTADQIAGGEHVKMAPNGTLATNSRALRAQSNLCRLETVVTVAESGGKFSLDITVRGTDDVPVAIELAFRPGGQLEGVEALHDVKDGHLLRAGTGRYRVGQDVISFGPGGAPHTYTQLRGALPKWEGQSVYVTGLTPFHTTLTIG